MPTVLLLRARASCEALSFLLEDEGVEVVHHPVLDVAWPEDPRALQAAAESATRYRFVVPDAPGAVQGFLEASVVAGTRRTLAALQWLAPDLRTARAVERAGCVARLVEDTESCCAPGQVHSHSAWASVGHGLVETDDEVLVLHESRRVPAWAEALRAGRGRLTTVRAWVDQPVPPLETTPDLVVIDSAAAADVLLADERLRGVKVVAPANAAANAVKALGLAVTHVALAPDAEALCAAVVDALWGGQEAHGGSSK
jgi:uroporphyrinogen-III synthase